MVYDFYVWLLLKQAYDKGTKGRGKESKKEWDSQKTRAFLGKHCAILKNEKTKDLRIRSVVNR